MIQDVLTFAAEKSAEEKVALVTVTETSGSSPASPGQMMAVLADGTIMGTVGGGASEYRIIKQAVAAIENGESIFKFSFDHAEEGMACGGGMAGFGHILGSGQRLCIFGGGHIAQSLAKIASLAGFYVIVIEDRAEFAPYFEGTKYVVCEPPLYEEAGVSSSDYIVICTRGHSTDEQALRFGLSKKPRYIGMIGSKNKVSLLMRKLLDDGFSPEDLKNVYTPIGLDIASALPAEIAVSILAEILLVKNKGTPHHKKTGME